MHAAAKPFHHADPSQYAEFDVSRKGDQDALPEMPSWEASSSKVRLDDVEMDRLNQPSTDPSPLVSAPPSRGGRGHPSPAVGRPGALPPPSPPPQPAGIP